VLSNAKLTHVQMIAFCLQESPSLPLAVSASSVWKNKMQGIARTGIAISGHALHKKQVGTAGQCGIRWCDASPPSPTSKNT